MVTSHGGSNNGGDDALDECLNLTHGSFIGWNSSITRQSSITSRGLSWTIGSGLQLNLGK